MLLCLFTRGCPHPISTASLHGTPSLWIARWQGVDWPSFHRLGQLHLKSPGWGIYGQFWFVFWKILSGNHGFSASNWLVFPVSTFPSSNSMIWIFWIFSGGFSLEMFTSWGKWLRQCWDRVWRVHVSGEFSGKWRNSEKMVVNGGWYGLI